MSARWGLPAGGPSEKPPLLLFSGGGPVSLKPPRSFAAISRALDMASLPDIFSRALAQRPKGEAGLSGVQARATLLILRATDNRCEIRIARVLPATLSTRTARNPARRPARAPPSLAAQPSVSINASSQRREKKTFCGQPRGIILDAEYHPKQHCSCGSTLSCIAPTQQHTPADAAAKLYSTHSRRQPTRQPCAP